MRNKYVSTIMNPLTTEARRHRDICRCDSKLLRASLRLGVSVVKRSPIHQKNFLLNSAVRILLIMMFVSIGTSATRAKKIYILLKNGHVIDPANNINARLDVAIADGKIIEVAPGIATD